MSEDGNRLPLVRRARGYRLYDHRGRVFLDLCQSGGHTLLGHRGARLTTVLKDTISRGTISDLPSVYGARLERVLGRMFPGFAGVRVVSCRERALALAGRYLGREVAAEEVNDPASSGRAGGPVSLWRPLAPSDLSPLEAESVRVLLPVLPFAMGGAPAAVLFRTAPPQGFPASEPVSAVILAGTLRALADLARYRPAAWYRDDLLAGCPGWVQRGIYVQAGFPPERYAEVAQVFLEGHVLLSPRVECPSILPAEASLRELKGMLSLFRRYPGG